MKLILKNIRDRIQWLNTSASLNLRERVNEIKFLEELLKDLEEYEEVSEL